MDEFEEDWEREDGLGAGMAEERRMDGDTSFEALFGEDAEAPGSPEQAPLEDEPLQPPSPVGHASNAAAERRKAMQDLARRQAQRQGGDEEGGGGGGGAKKKRKRDKEKGKGRDGDGGGDGARAPRRGRLQRARGGSGEPGGGGSGDEEAALADEDVVAGETEADRDFIDDEGVPEGQRYHDNPEAELEGEPEAEEAAEGEEEEEGGPPAGGEEEEEDEFGKKRKRRERDTDAQLQAAVESMVAKMNIAHELDEGCVQRSAPATHKVKELPAVEAFLRQRKYHEYFILGGGLSAANKWISPYDNGTLPTLLLRAKVAELLGLLPINTAIDSLKEVLQKSGLGRVVMFYSNFHGDSTEREEAVRRRFQKLLQTWMEPIVVDPEREREKRRRQAAENEKHRRLALLRAKEEAAALDKRRAKEAEILPGEKGFRRHAYIPTAAKLDYVHNPGSAAAGGGGGGGGAKAGRRRGEEDEDNDGGFGAMAAVAPEPGRGGRGGGGGGGGAPEVSPLARKMREMERARKGKTARAAKVSVEGRNITLM